MDNFNLKKYLAENEAIKRRRYASQDIQDSITWFYR